jgi:hypothetical protein
VYLRISYDSQNEQRFYPATTLKAIENGDIKVFLCGKNSIVKYFYLYLFFYLCTVHFEDALIITYQQMH